MVEIVVSPRTQTLPGVPITISGPHTNMTPTVYKGTSGGQQIIVIPQSLLQQSGVSTFLNGTGIVTSSSNVPKKAIIRLSPKSPTMSTTISSSTLSPSIGTKRPLPSSSPDIDSLSSSDDSDMPIRKRANLDHLSPEEKMMRRKLKNRVAAQNARDKKRVKMDEMEFVIKDLQDERMRLESENGRLAALNERLMSENEILRASSTNVLNVDAIKDEMPLSPASLPRSPMPPSLSDQGIVVSRASEPAELTNELLPKGQGRDMAVKPSQAALTMAVCLLWTLLKKAPVKPTFPPKIASTSRHLAESPLSTTLTTFSSQSTPAPRTKKPILPLKKRTWWGPQQRNWSPAKT